jgi:hypothetical protein
MAEEMTLESVQTELAAAKARIAELNQENAGHRLNAKNEKTRADDLAGKLEAAQREAGEKLTAAEARIAEAGTKVKQATLDAALKLAAKDAGIRDMDALKLLDTSKIEIGDDLTVKIPEKFWEEAKKSKPYIFGEATTSQTQAAPKPSDKTTSAVDMAPEAYEAARQAYLNS